MIGRLGSPRPRCALALVLVLALALGCGAGSDGGRARVEASSHDAAPTAAPAPASAPGRYVARLQHDAQALDPLVTSELGHRFLGAAREMPSIAARRIYRDASSTHYYAARDLAALTPEARRALVPIDVDESHYYDGDIAEPLHYIRALDIAAGRGLALPPGAKVMDFGYGAIGQLRMLASLGLDVTGVDVKPAYLAIYSERGDTGPIATRAGGAPGQLRVLNGFFPTDAKLVADVGSGYDLVISKNTLKKGYIHPDRPAPENRLIRLGVDDATFLARFYALLRPGGRVLLYNIFLPIPDDKPFLPMSDGRSPWTRDQWTAAGFTVEAIDEDDSEMSRKVLATTHHPEDDADDPLPPATLGAIRALYTIVRR